MTHSLPPQVEKLLQDLQPAQTFNALRKSAARELGQLSASDRRVVSALLAAAEADPAPIVRRQAAQSLQATVHQTVLLQHPDLLKKALELQAAQESQRAPSIPAQEPPGAPSVICEQCGEASDDANLNYCPHCGHRLAHALRSQAAQDQLVPGGETALLREIRSWGWWSLLLGVMHLLLPGLSAPWGLMLLVVGAASFYFREAAMLAVYGVTLAWVAISNAIFGGADWTAFAVLQVVFAVRVFVRFYNFRRAEAELDSPPDESRAARLFPGAGCIFGAISLGCMAITVVSLVLLFTSTDVVETPDFFVWVADFAVHLGVLGLAVNLAALFSGYRYRWLSALGLLASLPAVLIIIVLALNA